MAEGLEVMRIHRLRPYLGASKNLRQFAIDLFYSEKTFIFKCLDDFQTFVKVMPVEAKRLPLSIEVGLWANAPRKTWAMAKNLNIHDLTLVLHPNSNVNIPTKHRNDLEFMHGNKDLRKLRGVHAIKVVWILKAGPVQMYKKDWINAKVWEQKLQVVT